MSKSKKSNSGTSSYSKVNSRNTKVFPDKAYDPMKEFRNRLADNNDKNAPRTSQREENVIEQDYNYPNTRDNFKQIKNFLKTMNLKK